MNNKQEQITQAVEKERVRIRELLKDIGDVQLELIAGQIDSAAWLKVQLEKQRKEIGAGSSTYASTQDNGQLDIKKNPMFAQYKQLNDAYNATMKTLSALLAKAPNQEEDNPFNSWLEK